MKLSGLPSLTPDNFNDPPKRLMLAPSMSTLTLRFFSASGITAVLMISFSFDCRTIWITPMKRIRRAAIATRIFTVLLTSECSYLLLGLLSDAQGDCDFWAGKRRIIFRAVFAAHIYFMDQRFLLNFCEPKFDEELRVKCKSNNLSGVKSLDVIYGGSYQCASDSGGAQILLNGQRLDFD